MQRTLPIALSLVAILMISTIVATHPAYAASITKFKIEESGTATLAGKKHNISFSLEGSFRLAERASSNAKGAVTIDDTSYPSSSSVVKVDPSGKKVSISIKLPSKGSVRATMIFPGGVDLGKPATVSSRHGSIIASISGSTYKVKTVSSTSITLETIESNIS
jgi:hypothetical protein